MGHLAFESYKEVLSLPCAANPVVRPSPSAILAPAPISAIGTWLKSGQDITFKNHIPRLVHPQFACHELGSHNTPSPPPVPQPPQLV